MILLKTILTIKSLGNNNDLIKVISTVVKTIYYFLNLNPMATIEISGVDKKRTQLYNFIFKRRIQEIVTNFEVLGIYENGKKEKYNPEKIYQKFEIQLKRH